MAEIWQWNTADTAAQIRDGRISAREVTAAHLARLDEVNPRLNAVTNDVREEALATAAACDEAQAQGRLLGRLHGVPITIKENVDVKGQLTPNGMEAFEEVIAPADSPMVTNLKRSGAVIVGRTNTPEMSYRWHTDNPLRGETKNPWSTKRTAGGSSGGAASSVVSGIGTFAHGNDLGGSVRQPANCCGLATIRPSLGRVPAFNPSATVERTLALQLMSVQGPLAREVADVRLALEVMAQPSPVDPWHHTFPLVRPANTTCRVAATYGVPGGQVDPEVRRAVNEAAHHLAEAGYEVEFVDPPHLAEIRPAWLSILATETAMTGLDHLRDVVSKDFRRILGWMFDDDVILDLSGYVQAWARRATILRAWTVFLDQHPLVLAPISQLVPFEPNDDASGTVRFHEIMDGHAPLVAVNYLGLPAAGVPSILTDDGPIGVQLIGAPFQEGRCLDAAAAIEARVGVMAEQLWAR